MRLLYAEALKIRTAPRTAIGLALGLLLLVGLGSAATASSAEPEFSIFEDPTRDVIRAVSIAPVFTLILGILVVTWEYRHGTITQTFLATPKRERVVGAKLLASFVAGGILAVAAVALALVVATFWMTLDLEGEHWGLAGRMLVAAALWAILGTGLGALMQSQVGAIITAFVWFLVVEPVFGVTIDLVTDSNVADYLPGSAIDRLQDTEAPVEEGSGDTPFDPVYSYGLWTAALLASAYAAGFAALGIASAVRRDVP
jgi:ABC-2 type transport system permease protein